VVYQLDERNANRQLLCWSGMTDTEHITSDSNEEEPPLFLHQRTPDFSISWFPPQKINHRTAAEPHSTY